MSDQQFKLIPLNQPLFVAGTSQDRKVGEVSGLALAIGWHPEPDEPESLGQARRRRRRDPPEIFYLVSDPRRTTPVWLSADELTQQAWSAAEGIGASPMSSIAEDALGRDPTPAPGPLGPRTVSARVRDAFERFRASVDRSRG